MRESVFILKSFQIYFYFIKLTKISKILKVMITFVTDKNKNILME